MPQNLTFPPPGPHATIALKVTPLTLHQTCAAQLVCVSFNMTQPSRSSLHSVGANWSRVRVLLPMSITESTGFLGPQHHAPCFCYIPDST